jgi:hypothetical protein
MKLSPGQFHEAVTMALGFAGTSLVVNDVIAAVDDESEGMVCFADWDNWMQGRSGRRRTARSLRLTDRSEAAPPLTEIKWSKAALLRELNAMLGRR